MIDLCIAFEKWMRMSLMRLSLIYFRKWGTIAQQSDLVGDKNKTSNQISQKIEDYTQNFVVFRKFMDTLQINLKNTIYLRKIT